MTENLSLINPVNFSVKNQVLYDSNKLKIEKVIKTLYLKFFQYYSFKHF